VVPRRIIDRRGHTREEMDIDAVLSRKPAVALVDQLAHTNSAGTRHKKRWQDVEELLDAGIEVISTVNIDQLDSLKDIVVRITGITQRETIPDEVVRSAEQLELVDMSPEALRRRLSHGNIYKQEKVDAALNGYFRTGNLGALRVLALLWMADRVEEALFDRRDRRGNLLSPTRPGAPYHPSVMVAVDEVTQGVISAIEYGRLLRPERLQGLHVDTDEETTLGLAQEWYRHFRSRVPLVVVDPSGRSVADSCARTILEYMPAPEHPVVIIIPRRWHKGLHPRDEQDADDIASTLAALENVYVLFAPDFGP
jgi:hypothetical protein